MQFTIGGLQKTSLLDYPDKLSAIVFTQGCNFNCGYCHNPSLLGFKSKTDISLDVFFDFLRRRQGKLDGVVITGGEPTLQKDLIPFIKEIKKMGFLVKLDTNGTNPKVLETLLKDNLIDYIAMDIKTSIEKYCELVRKQTDILNIERSVKYILNSNIEYEFRTTVLRSFISFDDFEEIGEFIKGAKRYYLQKFEVQSEINDSSLISENNYTDEEFYKILEIMKKYVQYAELR